MISMSKPVYFVVVLSDVEAVRKRLREVVPEETMVFEVDEDKWFVSFDGISRDLAEKLGIRGEPNIGSGIVIPVTSYSGRANPALWEWLSLRMT